MNGGIERSRIVKRSNNVMPNRCGRSRSCGMGRHTRDRSRREKANGVEPSVEVVPKDAEFAAEIQRRVEQNRFHTMGFFQAIGFACFPEDYAKYHAPGTRMIPKIEKLRANG